MTHAEAKTAIISSIEALDPARLSHRIHISRIARALGIREEISG